MSRNSTLRYRLPSETVARSVAAAQNGRYLVVGNPGPTCFVIKADKKKYRVNIGETNSCSCQEEGCPHTMFVMLKALRVPDGHPILWQRGVNDKEVNDLLAGTLARMKQAIKKRPNMQRVAKREITEESECPICFEGIVAGEDLSHCRKGCGNYVHTACIAEWAAHAGGKASCPLCRADWGSIPIRRASKSTAPRTPVSHDSECKQCRNGAITGPKYSCTRCVGFDLCSRCIQDPLVHPSHPFVEFKRPNSNSVPYTRFQQPAPPDSSISGSGIHAGRSLIHSRRRMSMPNRAARNDSSSGSSFGICGVGLAARTASTGDLTNRNISSSSQVVPPPVVERLVSMGNLRDRTIEPGNEIERLVGTGSPPIVSEPGSSFDESPSTSSAGAGAGSGVVSNVATREFVNCLPFSQFVSPDDYNNSICPTCTQPFSYLDTVRSLPCEHIFHSQCAMWWLTECSIACPICGQDCL